MPTNNPTSLDLAASIDRVLFRNIQVPTRDLLAAVEGVTDFDWMMFLNTSGGVVTAVLPPAAGRRGMVYEFRRTVGTTSAVILADAADTIDGVSFRILNALGTAMRIVSDGVSTWRILQYIQLSSEPIIWFGDSSNPAEVFSNEVITLEFPNNVERGAVAELVTPNGLDTSVSVSLTVNFIVTGTGAGNATIGITNDLRDLAVGDLTTEAPSVTVGSSPSITDILNRVHILTQTFSGSFFTQGKLMNFHMTRPTGDAFSGQVGLARQAHIFFLRRQ